MARTRNLLWCHDKVSFGCLVDFDFLHQLHQRIVDHLYRWLLHVCEPASVTKGQRDGGQQVGCRIRSCLVPYLERKRFRMFSIVADWPWDVSSMITSQSASVRGVNCVCTIGVTIQSSISPGTGEEKEGLEVSTASIGVVSVGHLLWNKHIRQDRLPQNKSQIS